MSISVCKFSYLHGNGRFPKSVVLLFVSLFVSLLLPFTSLVVGSLIHTIIKREKERRKNVSGGTMMMTIKTRREFHSRSARNTRHNIEHPEHSEELNASLGGESKQKWNTKTTQKTRQRVDDDFRAADEMIKEIQFSLTFSFLFIRTVIPALAAGGRSDDPSSALPAPKGASIFAKLAPIIL
jgi:hypothetical protein